MMTYETFKEQFVNNFPKFVPEEYQHLELFTGSTQKVNQQLDYISMRDESKTPTMGPTLYISDFYEDYKVNNDMNEVLKAAATLMVDGLENMQNVVPALDYENARDNIVFRLINTQMNDEFLKNLPHREMEDLSIVYYWVIGDEDGNRVGAFVQNPLANMLDLTEEDLFALATENTKRLFPPRIESMKDLMKGMLYEQGASEDLLDELIEEDGPMKDLYVISNEAKSYGAASILYDEPLQKIADIFGEDFYIMPSSVHESIALPASMEEPSVLAEMVKEINESQVAKEERLSDNVYFYDKTNHTITIANKKETLLDKIQDAKKELEPHTGRSDPKEREYGFSY